MDWPAAPSWCPFCCAPGRVVLIKPMEADRFLAQCEDCTRPIILDRHGTVLKRADDVRG